VLVTAMAVGAHGAAKPKLNLLFIMADDLNADWKNDRLQWMPNLNKCVRVRGSVTHCMSMHDTCVTRSEKQWAHCWPKARCTADQRLAECCMATAGRSRAIACSAGLLAGWWCPTSTSTVPHAHCTLRDAKGRAGWAKDSTEGWSLVRWTSAGQSSLMALLLQCWPKLIGGSIAAVRFTEQKNSHWG
jgi:hypothetical protein